MWFTLCPVYEPPWKPVRYSSLGAIEAQWGNLDNFENQPFQEALLFPPSLCVIILRVKSLLRILKYLQVHLWRMFKISLPCSWPTGQLHNHRVGEKGREWAWEVGGLPGISVTALCPEGNWMRHWIPKLTREETVISKHSLCCILGIKHIWSPCLKPTSSTQRSLQDGNIQVSTLLLPKSSAPASLFFSLSSKHVPALSCLCTFVHAVPPSWNTFPSFTCPLASSKASTESHVFLMDYAVLVNS